MNIKLERIREREEADAIWEKLPCYTQHHRSWLPHTKIWSSEHYLETISLTLNWWRTMCSQLPFFGTWPEFVLSLTWVELLTSERGLASSSTSRKPSRLKAGNESDTTTATMSLSIHFPLTIEIHSQFTWFLDLGSEHSAPQSRQQWRSIEHSNRQKLDEARGPARTQQQTPSEIQTAESGTLRIAKKTAQHTTYMITAD